MKAWFRNGEKTVTGRGRRRKSDMCTVGCIAARRAGASTTCCARSSASLPHEYARIRGGGSRQPWHGTTESGARALQCGGAGGSAAPAAGLPPLHYFGSTIPTSWYLSLLYAGGRGAAAGAEGGGLTAQAGMPCGAGGRGGPRARPDAPARPRGAAGAGGGPCARRRPPCMPPPPQTNK